MGLYDKTVDVDAGFAPKVTANLRNLTILRRLAGVQFPFDFEDAAKKAKNVNILIEASERALLGSVMGASVWLVHWL
jgi:hypothetical protein